MSKQLFNVVRLHRDKPCEVLMEQHGKPIPLVWESGDAAQYYITNYLQDGGKYQVRVAKPIDPDEWRVREQKRLDSGEYALVPWHKEAWVSKVKECVDHFVHVSKDDRTRVAFTINAVNGQRDIQTRMSPSKYLNHYYSALLSEAVIRKWLAAYRKEHGADYELKFTTNGQEIVAIYENGPGSCMSGSKEVVAYGDSPDLALAYITRKDGSISARSIVWPEKKLYCILYGDCYLMEQLLDDEGYKQGRPIGARIRHIKNNDGDTVLPSIDGAYNVTYGKEFITIV